jgi:Caspase domain
VEAVVDEQATREGIWDVLNSHLLENTKIKPGDAVVIYYAGHGTVYPANRFRPRVRDHVEAILPIDRGEKKDGKMVPDIFDFELKGFLKRLNKSRTRNITVVFDCCYSGSMTRSTNNFRGNQQAGLENITSVHNPQSGPVAGQRDKLEEPSVKVRWSFPLVEIPPEMKELYYTERTSSLTSTKDLSTHVCIAACQDSEYAWEHRNEGAFTRLLLMRLAQLPISSTSYAQLEESFRGELTRQEPVIYGNTELKQSILFQIGASP